MPPEEDEDEDESEELPDVREPFEDVEGSVAGVVPEY